MGHKGARHWLPPFLMFSRSQVVHLSTTPKQGQVSGLIRTEEVLVRGGKGFPETRGEVRVLETLLLHTAPAAFSEVGGACPEPMPAEFLPCSGGSEERLPPELLPWLAAGDEVGGGCCCDRTGGGSGAGGAGGSGGPGGGGP